MKRVGQLVQIDRRLTQHQGGENVIVVVAESLVATHDADATVVRRARDATVRVEAVDNASHCASRQEQGRGDSVGAVVVKVPQKHHAPQQVRGEHRATCFCAVARRVDTCANGVDAAGDKTGGYLERSPFSTVDGFERSK